MSVSVSKFAFVKKYRTKIFTYILSHPSLSDSLNAKQGGITHSLCTSLLSLCLVLTFLWNITAVVEDAGKDVSTKMQHFVLTASFYISVCLCVCVCGV